jgi:hypothetical protein
MSERDDLMRKLLDEAKARVGAVTFGEFMMHPEDCPDGPHRGPEGPNEDIAACWRCGMPSWVMRPDGEEFGGHIADCSLPRRHEGYCVGGGKGHPTPKVMRG